MTVRARCRKVFSIWSDPVKNSVRKISKVTGISKSSAHRHAQAIKKRNVYPEWLPT